MSKMYIHDRHLQADILIIVRFAVRCCGPCCEYIHVKCVCFNANLRVIRTCGAVPFRSPARTRERTHTRTPRCELYRATATTTTAAAVLLRIGGFLHKKSEILLLAQSTTVAEATHAPRLGCECVCAIKPARTSTAHRCMCDAKFAMHAISGPHSDDASSTNSSSSRRRRVIERRRPSA